MEPPFSITPSILDNISRIERLIGRVESLNQPKPQPYLRKSNRVKTVQGSLAIEGNSLALEQVTALIEGKTVAGKKSDIQEVLNAIAVYDQMSDYDYLSPDDLLKAHGIMMGDLIKTAGKWRRGNVGIMKGSAVSHIAPQANRVPHLMSELFEFLKNNNEHPLISGCIFHYELEFIHPLEDGNGRMGRFWHSLLLHHYHPVFEFIPVESLIKENQKDYYRALEQADHSGDSTPFVEFSLSTIRQALATFLDELNPLPLTTQGRLEIARTHFKKRTFSRKDYLKHFKTISSATASRDLKFGVDNELLSKQGDKAQTIYNYLSE
jgi:Fic family protein